MIARTRALALGALLALLAISPLLAPRAGFAQADPAEGPFAGEDDELGDLFDEELDADLADPDATGREVTAEEGAPADAGSPTDQADGGFEDKRMEATAPDLSSDFEEILIVGEAKEAIAQKETTSVVSFDVDTLRMENIQNIADLSNLTPNLEIKTAFAASNPTLFIRGIGLDDYNANSSSAVAVYQDGVYMNSPVGQLFQLFDVASIDVLRGPQARRRNANAGAILINSSMPSDEFESYAEVRYGRFNRLTVEGALNTPIFPEILSSRLSFVVNKGDGITKNRCADRSSFLAPPPQACRQDDIRGKIPEHVNDTDNWAARGLFLLTPQTDGWEAPEILLNVHGGQNDSYAAQFQHRGFRGRFGTTMLEPGPDRYNYQDIDGDPFAGDYNAQGKEEIDLLGGSVRATWSLSDTLEVVSLSAYEWHDRRTVANDDASPRQWFDHFLYRDDAWQLSQELTLTWLVGDSGQINLSGLFLMEDLHVDNTFPNERDGTRKPRIEQEYWQDTRGFSIYAYGRSEIPAIDGLPEFLANFAVDATVRYSYEFKNFDLFSQATISDFAGNRIVLPQQDQETDESWQGVSGDLSLTYYLGRHWDNEEVSIYAKYSRGWKPGHFNGGTAFAVELVEPVDPETVDSFEGGLKSRWWDGRLELNLAAFYYGFDDQQIFQLQQEGTGVPLPRLINAQESTIFGAEIELFVEPIDGLEMQVNAGWLDSEYSTFRTRIVQGGGTIITPPTIFEADYSGNRLLSSPDWSGQGHVQYTWQTPWGSLRPRWSVSFRDDVFFDPNEGAGARGNLPHGTIGQDAYWLHNAALTYVTPSERIEVTGWIRNIFDEEYRVQSFDLTERSFQFVVDAYGDPQTYGVTVVFRF